MPRSLRDAVEELDAVERNEALLLSRLAPKAVPDDHLRHKLDHWESLVVCRRAVPEGACKQREDVDVAARVLHDDLCRVQFRGAGSAPIHESMTGAVKRCC